MVSIGRAILALVFVRFAPPTVIGVVISLLGAVLTIVAGFLIFWVASFF